MLTPKHSAPTKAGHDDDERLTQMIREGGSTESEDTEGAMKPASRPLCRQEIALTPAANSRVAARNTSPSGFNTDINLSGRAFTGVILDSRL
jgi:hypothetical protein